MQHINHLLHTMQLELDASIKLPETRRGYPRGTARVKKPDGAEQGRRRRELRAATDDAIVRRLDAALAEARKAVLAAFEDENDVHNVEAIAARLSMEKLRDEAALLVSRKRVPPGFFSCAARTQTRDVGDEDGDDDEDDDGAGGDDTDDPRPNLDRGARAEELRKMTMGPLKDILKDYGLRTGGLKRDLIERIVDHENFRGALDAVPTDEVELQALSSQSATKDMLKKEANRWRFISALQIALNEAEEKQARDARTTTDAAESDSAGSESLDGLYKASLLYAQLVNTSFVRVSRERTGGRNRFVDQEVLSNVSNANDNITDEHKELIGRRFQDKDGIWRVLSKKDGVQDSDGLLLDGIFFDDESQKITVCCYEDGLLHITTTDLQSETYDSLLESAQLLDDDAAADADSSLVGI